MSEIQLIKFFVSRSFDLIQGNWECEKHAVMLGCLCKSPLRKDDGIYLQNGET